MKKFIAFIRIDSMIDLITNSSSELFVIENTMAKPMLVELVNEALKGFSSIDEDDIECRINRDSYSIWEQDSMIEDALRIFPESTREEIKEKYLKDPKYYGISFDRDNISQSYVDVRGKLAAIGFELIDTDY